MEIRNHYLPSPDGGVVPEERPKFSGFVRPLQEEDLVSVKPILETWIRNMMTGAIMPEEVEEDLQSMRASLAGLNQQAYFVAEEAGRVTGLVGTQNPPKESLMQFARTQNPIELIRIYVSLEHTKGRGVGSALVDTVRAESRAKGFGEILLDSGPRYRHSGWGFHDKQFTRLGIVKDQYGPGIDARVWGEVLTSVMSAEEESHLEKVSVGGIYEHLGDSKHPYRVIAVYPDATRYEEAGKVSGSTVVYEQRYEGVFPDGTVWTRSKEDFIGVAEIDGKTVKKFTLVENPQEE